MKTPAASCTRSASATAKSKIQCGFALATTQPPSLRRSCTAAKCTSARCNRVSPAFAACSSSGDRSPLGRNHRLTETAHAKAAETAHDRYLAQRHFGSLDGLRCLSIVPVIWHHATPRPLPGIWGKGPAGVDLFFCISGFLITTLLLRERAREGRIALGAFYLRRALRILPLYYAVLLSYLAFALCLPPALPQRAHFFDTLPLYASFTANWFADFGVSHPILFSFAWSLCIEEQFYAFWPWLVRWLSARAALLAMCALITVDCWAERSAFGGYSGRILTSFAAPIGFGALLALLLDGRRAFDALYCVFKSSWS